MLPPSLRSVGLPPLRSLRSLRVAVKGARHVRVADHRARLAATRPGLV